MPKRPDTAKSTPSPHAHTEHTHTHDIRAHAYTHAHTLQLRSDCLDSRAPADTTRIAKHHWEPRASPAPMPHGRFCVGTLNIIHTRRGKHPCHCLQPHCTETQEPGYAPGRLILHVTPLVAYLHVQYALLQKHRIMKPQPDCVSISSILRILYTKTSVQ